MTFPLAGMAIEIALLEEELDHPLLSRLRLDKNDFFCGRLLFAVQANPLPESHTKRHREQMDRASEYEPEASNNESCMWLCRFY